MAEPKRGTRPIMVEETPGKKAYCQCGWSGTLPYCDGSHSRMNTGCTPYVCEITEPAKKWICQCGTSANRPWCDGSHKKLAVPPPP